jgi:hypothetical protein
LIEIATNVGLDVCIYDQYIPDLETILNNNKIKIVKSMEMLTTLAEVIFLSYKDKLFNVLEKSKNIILDIWGQLEVKNSLTKTAHINKNFSE